MATQPSKAGAAAKAAVKSTPAKAPAKRGTKAAAEAPAAVAKDKGKGEALLRAGLKALDEARVRQTRVVETLLGIPAGVTTMAPKAALDSLGNSLGFRKLEDVFDQRIAAALERLGIPSAEEFAALREQVRVLSEERDKAAPRPRR
jgi:hypothetical protein